MSNAIGKSGIPDPSGPVLSTVVEVGTELASLPASTDLFEYLGRTLRRITGASAVVVSEHLPERGELVPRHIESESRLLQVVNRVVGRDVRLLRTPLGRSDHQLILRERVAYLNSLTEVTFGQIPEVVSRLFRAATGIHRMVGLKYIFEGQLYGTSMLAFHRDAPLPPQQLLESFASLAAVSLRRRQAEDNLREIEERYRSLADRSRLGVLLIDLEGRVLDANPVLLGLVGMTREEAPGTSIYTFIDPAEAQAGRDRLVEIVRTGRSTGPAQWRIRGRDGAERWLEVQGARVDRNGRPHGIHFIVRDITAQREIEAALRESERRYRNLFENAAIGIYRTTPGGEVLEANPALLKMLGYGSFEEMARRNLEEGGFDPGYPRAEFRQRIERDGEIRGFEANWTRRDGTEICARENARVIRDDQNRVQFYEGTVEDVTEQRRAEQRLEAYAAELSGMNEHLRHALEAAEEATRLKSRFLANMSHEIRTPMNGVIGMLDLLATTPLNDEQQGYVDVVRGSAQSLLAILGDILDLSRIEAGRLRLESIAFDLAAELSQTVGLCRFPAGAKGLSLTLELAPEARRSVLGDPGRLRQVLTNLIGNAVKFTETGGVRVAVHALPEEPDGKLRYGFRVCDTGIGFDLTAHPDLFSPFKQVDASSTRRHGGAGLGLAISRQLVEMMGGRIGCESRPGEGSTFFFELPFAAAPEPCRPGPEPPNGAEAQGVPRARVLLAEDNAVNQRIARLMLAKAGIEAEVARNGREVLEQLGRGAFDLVFMDVQMPEMDGFETTSAIRACEAAAGTARIPVVAMTANAMAGDRERCLEAGMDDYISKPFTQADLLAAIRRWVPAGRGSVKPERG